jgi:hypothetical protein
LETEKRIVCILQPRGYLVSTRARGPENRENSTGKRSRKTTRSGQTSAVFVRIGEEEGGRRTSLEDRIGQRKCALEEKD